MHVQKTICIVAQPRSGTNHLCRLMESLWGIRVYLEVFNHVRPYVHYQFPLEAFERKASQTFADWSDPSLPIWLRQNPETALEILRQHVPPADWAMSFKIFSDHLSLEQFENAIVRRDDVCFLMLKRRPIDAYISFQKAVEVSKWLSKDTTDVRPTIDADHFVAWNRRHANWFQATTDLIQRHGRPLATLQYETDIKDTEEETLKTLIGHLGSIGVRTRLRHDVRMKRPVKRLLQSVVSRVGMQTPWDPALGLKRQDRNDSTGDKVTNWNAFLKDLTDRHDPRLLEAYVPSD